MGNIEGREYSHEDIQDLPDDYYEQVYTPRDLEQLDKFTHIHGAIDHVEENMNKNIGYFVGVKEGEPPKRENLIFMMDSRLNWFLHIMAYNMYREFEGSEKMKEAADSYINGRKIEKQMANEFEKRELQNLWDQP